MTADPHRFYVLSPDGRLITGLDTPDGARAAALGYGDGAVVVDTLAQAYYPVAEEVAGGELLHGGIAGWNAGRADPAKDLIMAVKTGNAAVVQAFLAKGSGATSRDANGGTALHWAASRGNAEIVKLLLDSGADPAATDGDGKTALDIAKSKGKAKLVALLG